jgi:hypothetical protein
LKSHHRIRKTVLAFLFILLAAYQIQACTIAVVSGSVTIDGRPLLWKNRDVSQLDQLVRFFDDGSRGGYLTLLTSNVNETTTSYVGVNDAGFSIMNSIAYDLSTHGPTSHGSLMKRALRECGSVAEFEALLVASSGDRGYIWSNFGVIDSQGEAAIFEVNDWDYRRYDADDEGGFVVRANNSVWGGGYLGSRYERAQLLLTDTAAAGQLDSQFFTQVLSRDLGEVPGMPCGQWSTIEPAINRHLTRSSVIVHGVLAGEDPRLTTFWTCLGEPSCGIFVPLWSSAGTPPEALCAPGQRPALCAAVLAKELQCYYNLTQDTTIDTEALVGIDGLGGIQGYTLPIEDETFSMTADQLEEWRATPPDDEALARFQSSMLSRSYALLINERAPDAGGNIFCLPDSETLSLADENPPGSGIYAEEILVTYSGGEAAPLYGYSIDITWNPAILSAASSDFEKPATGCFSVATFFQALLMEPGRVRIDAALGGTHPGTVAADLFKARFEAAAGLDYSTSDLSLTINFVRDSDNNDLNGFAADAGLVIVDLAGPSVSDLAISNTTLPHTDDFTKNGDSIEITALVTDGDILTGTDIRADLSGLGGGANVNPESYSMNLATWALPSVTCAPANGEVTIFVSADDPSGNASNLGNDLIIADNIAPTPMTGLTTEADHMEVALSWDEAAGNDSHFAGVILRYERWTSYPVYPPGEEPAYPGNPAEGLGTAFDGSGTLAVHSFSEYDRGIYYYSGFVYDIARNYSVLGSAGISTDRATNYWLADVAPGDYDGYVDVADISKLGAAYGSEPGDTSFNDEVDVGPTDNHSGMGIPLPDATVGFEDMMIFALNFSHVAPRTDMSGASEFAQLSWKQTGDTSAALFLEEPCFDLKGLHFQAALPPGLSFNLSAGDLLDRQTVPVFLESIEGAQLDISLGMMGTVAIVSGQGELFRVTFSEAVQLSDFTIDVRNSANESIDLEFENPGAQTLPQSYSMARNYPNPFNPKTTIRFDLPLAQNVSLVVFDISGRRIITLVDEALDAGYHSVDWSGRDEEGIEMASGVYFYKIKAGPLKRTERMVLLK